MPTISQARAAVRSRIEAGNVVDGSSVAVPLRWQNENADSNGQVALPDQPSPFVYTEFITNAGALVSYGGGRGSNLYRTRAVVAAYVFVPKDEGLDEAESIAEQIAVLFRSYRDSTISCFDATVQPGGDGETLKPPGLDSAVGNYFWAVAEISLHFDQVG